MEKLTVEQGLEKYKKYMFRIAYRRAKGNYHDAEDIVSEANYLALSDEHGWLEFPAHFRQWVHYKVMKAGHIFLFGHASKRDASHYLNDDEKGLNLIQDDDVTPAVVAMSEIQRLPYPTFALCRYIGYTNEEIISALGITERELNKQSKANRLAFEDISEVKPVKLNGKSGIDYKKAREVLKYNPNSGHFTWIVDKGCNAASGQMAGHYDRQEKCMQIMLDGKRIKAHRLAWAMHHGIDKFGVIKHINGDKTDNRIENLEEKK